MPRGHKAYRSKARIYADILDSIMKQSGRSGPTRILYGANLSYDRLRKHLKALVQLELVKEEKKDDATIYTLTHKGRAFIVEFAKIERFAEAFGITI